MIIIGAIVQAVIAFQSVSGSLVLRSVSEFWLGHLLIPYIDLPNSRHVTENYRSQYDIMVYLGPGAFLGVT
jgi:hypothetical protein